MNNHPMTQSEFQLSNLWLNYGHLHDGVTRHPDERMREFKDMMDSIKQAAITNALADAVKSYGIVYQNDSQQGWEAISFIRRHMIHNKEEDD